MTKDEKAKIILEKFGEFFQVDWNFENIYLLGIKAGLNEVEKLEKAELNAAAANRPQA